MKYHQKIFSPNLFSIRLNIEPGMKLEPRTIFQGPPHRYRYFRDPQLQVYRCIRGGGHIFCPLAFSKNNRKISKNFHVGAFGTITD